MLLSSKYPYIKHTVMLPGPLPTAKVHRAANSKSPLSSKHHSIYLANLKS